MSTLENVFATVDFTLRLLNRRFIYVARVSERENKYFADILSRGLINEHFLFQKLLFLIPTIRVNHYYDFNSEKNYRILCNNMYEGSSDDQATLLIVDCSTKMLLIFSKICIISNLKI